MQRNQQKEKLVSLALENIYSVALKGSGLLVEILNSVVSGIATRILDQVTSP